MKTNTFPTHTDAAYGLIDSLIKLLDNDPDRIFNIAFSGGTTPAVMYDLWASEYIDSTPWNRIRFFFVDERCVSSASSDSNFGVMRSLLLNKVPVSDANVFEIKGECNPQEEAMRCSKQLIEVLPHENGWPVFDVVLLGAGSDGHTSSIFLGQEELLTSDFCYAPAYNPYTGQKRIAMTGQLILAAKKVIFFITGHNKSSVVNEILYSGDTGPAAYIAHHAADVELFIDGAAAGEVGKE